MEKRGAPWTLCKILSHPAKFAFSCMFGVEFVTLYLAVSNSLRSG
jgi:hypothetical protein